MFVFCKSLKRDLLKTKIESTCMEQRIVTKINLTFPRFNDLNHLILMESIRICTTAKVTTFSKRENVMKLYHISCLFTGSYYPLWFSITCIWGQWNRTCIIKIFKLANRNIFSSYWLHNLIISYLLINFCLWFHEILK